MSGRRVKKNSVDPRKRIVDDDEAEEQEQDSDASSAANSIFKSQDRRTDSSSSESMVGVDEPTFTNLDESKALLHEMIDTCQELDEKQGFQAEEDKMLRNQVCQSAKLFETQFMPESRVAEKAKSTWRRSLSKSRSSLDGASQQSEESVEIQDTPVSRKSRGKRQSQSRMEKQTPKRVSSVATPDQNRPASENIQPSYMFLAYKHTNMCAQLMRKRTEMMGLEDSVISMDEYLTGLKSQAERSNIEGDLDTRIYKLVSSPWKTAASLPTLVGSFDYREFLEKEGEVLQKPAAKKEAKKRTKQFDPDTLIATQEKVTISKKESSAKSKHNDETVRVFRNTLKDFSKNEPVSMLEFALNKKSVRESLNNMFGIAFGVRDGVISLEKEKGHLKVASLKPSTQSQNKMSARSQCIVTFSAASIRKMQAIAHGKTVVQQNAAAVDVQSED